MNLVGGVPKIVGSGQLLSGKGAMLQRPVELSFSGRGVSVCLVFT